MEKGIGAHRAFARVKALLDRVVLPCGGDKGSGSLRRITGQCPRKLETKESLPHLARSKHTSLGAISRPWHGNGLGLLAALAVVKYFEAPRFDENVESTRNGDGAVTLTSRSFNIKIDKVTTYVVATGDLLASRPPP